MDEQARPAPPCTLVIFGGAGDLTHRLLTPALLNLKHGGLLPERFALIGFARTPKTDESFRADLAAGLKQFAKARIAPADRDWLLQRASYVQSSFDNPAGYAQLKEALDKAQDKFQTDGNVLFYLATPASSFAPVVEQLGAAGLTTEEAGRWRRVIVEKPFGHDLPSAQELNRRLLAVLSEDQIYRIDHYLGKETVQNIMVFRFANGIYESMWNRTHIDHIQITVAETVGVETRGKFYDEIGRASCRERV